MVQMDGQGEELVEASERLIDARGPLSEELAADFFRQFPLESFIQCVLRGGPFGFRCSVFVDFCGRPLKSCKITKGWNQNDLGALLCPRGWGVG